MARSRNGFALLALALCLLAGAATARPVTGVTVTNGRRSLAQQAGVVNPFCSTGCTIYTDGGSHPPLTPPCPAPPRPTPR